MNAEVITIGTELLLGEIVDTNSSYIARQLRDIGVSIYYLTTVGDNRARIADAIRLSLSRADVVITTGGLGPTVDDMTRQAVAEATDRELVFYPELLEQIAARFRSFSVPMSDNNRIQAYIPAGAIPVENPVGTAPCFIVETDQGTVISLPGVPREMKHLLAERVLPYLRERMGGVGIIKARILRTAGIGESNIDAKIADLEEWDNPTVGLAAHTGQTDIRITARADTELEADRLIADAEAIVRERLGEHIFGVDDEELEAAFVQMLHARGWKLAVSYAGEQGESLHARLHRDGFGDSVVCFEQYEPDAAEIVARLGDVDDDDPCVLAKAEAARLAAESGAEVVVCIVTQQNGTGITARGGDRERSRCYPFGGPEIDAPVWAGTWGISMAWRLVRQEEG
ncbi:MAG: CinA family nicotinamide mononucleotide deamidase-related protein [Chloroflexi bacterium]|nr:CinA family nicotinamide mononucleotide deamidase-related protein [Chloroflexota bacterium]